MNLGKQIKKMWAAHPSTQNYIKKSDVESYFLLECILGRRRISYGRDPVAGTCKRLPPTPARSFLRAPVSIL